MNQKRAQFFKNCMQKPKFNIARLDLSSTARTMDKDNKVFTLRQIYQQATKILQSQGQIKLLDKQTPSIIESLKDLIIFIKNQNNINLCKINSYQQLQKPQKNQKYNSSSRHHDQIADLRKALQNKNQTIVHLNMMYQEAKLLFDQQTKNQQKKIQQMTKQVYQLRAQNEILKQKVEVLIKYRSQKELLNNQYNGKIVGNERDPQLKNQQIQPTIIKKCSINTGFKTSRKSSYHDIKDLIQVMSTNMQSNSDQLNENPIHKNNRFSYKNQSRHESQNTTINYCRYSPVTDKSISKKNSMESDIYTQQLQLIQEVSELRKNQSKLLDRIYERDEIISQLLKMKNITENAQQNVKNGNISQIVSNLNEKK